MFGKIKIDRADAEFSKYIRLRDGKCVRCGRLGGDTVDGELIKGLQASHYFGRGNEATRFDVENVDALCAGCHQIWGSDDREAYRVFKIKQLGENGFKLLQITANAYKKKDRKMSLIIAKELLKELKRKKTNKELIKPYRVND